VALDAPGHAGSTGRLSSLPQFADTVELADRHFGPLRGVVAHSFGAAGTGWSLWRSPGLEIERLVFVAAPGDLDSYMQSFRELFGLSAKSYDGLLEALERKFGVRWSESRHATTIAAGRTPMLVIHDRNDPETPYEGALAIESAWTDSRLVTTERLGHHRILREPRAIAEAVDFLVDPAVTAAPPDSATAVRERTGMTSMPASIVA
jgi:pimeloyl-ACP methyl ester carboxylesterase